MARIIAGAENQRLTVKSKKLHVEREKRRPWWSLNANVHEQVWSCANMAENMSIEHVRSIARDAALYSPTGELAEWSLLSPREGSPATQYNVVRSCVATVVSKIAKIMPRIQILTLDQDFEVSQRGEKLSRFIEGVFQNTCAHQVGKLVFRDAALFGTGIIAFRSLNDRILVERVSPGTLFFPNHEIKLHGKPKTYYRKYNIDRQELLSWSDDKDFKEAVLDAPRASLTSMSDITDVDIVTIVEAWRCVSNPWSSSEEGRYVVCVENAAIIDRTYPFTTPPIAIMNWDPPFSGIFGEGIGFELHHLQMQVNELCRTVDDTHRLMSVARFFVEEGSIDPKDLTNQTASIVSYKQGSPPPTASPGVQVDSGLYMHLEGLKRSAYEMAGISSLSAKSQKPSGLDSGAALREFTDIESERFADVQQRWDAFWIECAKIVVRLAKEMSSDGIDFSSRPQAKGSYLAEIKFSEVSLEEQDFQYSIYPSSSLPREPAGRIQAVKELLQAGIVDQSAAATLLNFPDTDRAVSLARAKYDCARSIVDNILSTGEVVAIEEWMPMQELITVGQASLLDAKINRPSIPESHTDALIDLINTLLEAKTEAMAAMPAPVAQQPMAPGV